MSITSYEKRIEEIKRSINFKEKKIANFEEEIEEARKALLHVTEKYQKLEDEVLEASGVEECKYTLSLMYRKLLSWHVEATEAARYFDEVNKVHIQHTISKLEIEHELEKLKELVERSGQE